MTKNSENRFTAPNTATGTGHQCRATSVIGGGFRMGLGLGGFLTPLRVLSFAVLVGSEPMDGRPL